jgi:hypothetical protein
VQVVAFLDAALKDLISPAERVLCRLPIPRHPTRYGAVAVDRWGTSAPLIAIVGRGDG